jgi:hypothetical protein
MSEESYVDPSGNTEQFRAYVQRAEPAGERTGAPPYLIIGIIAAVVVVGIVVAILAM